jgi:hypothetical protein
MMVLLIMWVLRSLLRRPRLAASCLAVVILVTVPDLLLRSFVDPDLPRPALLMLLLVLAAAGLFLRASWRRRREAAHGRPRTRPFALRIAVLRGRDGPFTRTAVVFDRYRRPPAGAGGAQPAGSGPGRISRR